MKSNYIDRVLIPIIFWVLGGTFLIIASQMFIPAIRNLLRGRNLFLVLLTIFLGLSLLLTVFVLRSGLKGKLKVFLVLTGGSALGFCLLIFLHNVFYGLGATITHLPVIHHLVVGLEIFFFLISVFICPLLFLVGMVGSMVMFFKKNAPSGFLPEGNSSKRSTDRLADE